MNTDAMVTYPKPRSRTKLSLGSGEGIAPNVGGAPAPWSMASPSDARRARRTSDRGDWDDDSGAEDPCYRDCKGKVYRV